MAFRPLRDDPIASGNGCHEEEGERSKVVEEEIVVLRRIIGLARTVSLILGMIIGTGIFLTPAGVLRGSSGSIGIALIIWLVGACISATGAVCFVELALFYRKSGGTYTYLSEFYGPALGFVYISSVVLVSSPAGTALTSLVVVKFLLTPFVGQCDAVPEVAVKTGATCVCLLAVFINTRSAKWPLKTQVFLTFIKVGAVLLIIVMGVVKVATDGTERFMTPFETTGGKFDWSKLPSAFFSAFYTVGGWSYLIMVIEEVRNPHRTIIKGMLISLTCTIVLYALANLAYFAVLTPEEMMASDAVAALFAVRVVGVRWSFIIWLCVVLSASGSLNGSTFTTARAFFVAGRAKQFPFIISTIHVTRRTPVAAIILPVPLALIYIWCTDIWSIINITTLLGLVMSILVTLIIPYLRWKQPDRNLKFKAPLWTAVVFLIFNISLLSATVITNPAQIGFTAAICVVSLIGYYVYQWTGRSQRAGAVAASINNFLQKLLYSVEQEVATF